MELQELPAQQGQSSEVSIHQPLQASVSNCLSLLRSRRLNNSTEVEGISPRALALRNENRPSEISAIYNLSLQKELIQCKDLSLLNNIKETPTLCMLEQAWGMEFVSGVIIKAHLLAVSEFVGVKTKMEDWQMDELCTQIAMEYGDLNVLEFICFCSRLRSGRYETFYGSIDPTQITKSLADFYEDRRSDINRAWEKAEKERRDKEWEESRKNAISFEEWYESLPEEKKAEVEPMRAIFMRSKEQPRKKHSVIKKVADTLFGK